MVPMEETSEWYAQDMHPLKSLSTDQLDYQSRRNGKFNWNELHESVLKDGVREPLTVNVDENGDKTLLDGHHRYLAAKNVGLTHIPVRYVND
jgi:ParB-like chromosome segregation protein Spo0J